MWSEKYRPASLGAMAGSSEERERLSLWLKRWKRGTKSALLVGPPGTGKTTTVHLAAKELGLQLVELNASDARTKDKLSKAIGELMASASLSGSRSLIFLDEVDGLSGRSDYGAIEYIKEAVKKSESPIVMAANDPESDEVRKLAGVTTRFDFRKLDGEAVEGRLAEIAESEGVELGEGELARISQAADGDVRVAINLLQSGGSATKDVEVTPQESIDAFFDAADVRAAQKALRAYPGPPRDKMRDLFHSVVKAKVHESRKGEALEALSRADIIMGRMVRGRDWRLLRYLDSFLAAELWTALGDGGARFARDPVPWMMQLRIWNDSRKIKDVGALVGGRLGTSQRGAVVEDMPYILAMCAGREFRDAFVESLGLEKNYADFLEKEASRSGRGAR